MKYIFHHENLTRRESSIARFYEKCLIAIFQSNLIFLHVIQNSEIQKRIKSFLKYLI